jgi:hypothetical protein
MSYLLVFNNSGDVIPFDPVNQEVLDFYIDQLTCQGLNKFFPVGQNLGKAISKEIDAIRLSIQQINEWLFDLTDTEFKVCDPEGYLDQQLLNHIHAQWVQSQSIPYDIQKKRKQFNYTGIAEQIHDIFPDDIQNPPLGVVIEKIGKKNIFDSLNSAHVHMIESLFHNIKYQVSSNWTKIADNHFPKTILNNNISNLSIPFNHLGRTLYNKFVNFDHALECNDENSFNELLGSVALNLQPSETIGYSSEYLTWCKSHNKEPIGNFLNIGNIPNLYENLTKYRTIIFKNLLTGNSFSIYKT